MKRVKFDEEITPLDKTTIQDLMEEGIYNIFFSIFKKIN